MGGGLGETLCGRSLIGLGESLMAMIHKRLRGPYSPQERSDTPEGLQSLLERESACSGFCGDAGGETLSVLDDGVGRVSHAG